MTPGARYQAVMSLFDTVLAEKKPADQIMRDYFQQRKFIGSKDRKFITETIYDVMRHYGRLSWWATKTSLSPNGRGLVLLWLVLGLQANMQEIADLFDGQGYAPDTLTTFEKRVVENLYRAEFMPTDMPETVRLEIPDWTASSMKKLFKDDLSLELSALNQEASLDLRVNTLKTNRDSVIKKMRADDIDVVPTPLSPYGLRVVGRPPFSAHPLYRDGFMEVQDEGSQLLGLLCGVKPGEWVVDFCAGAGGKTLVLAAQMQNKGRIWACDIEAHRLENSRKRLRRAGVHCVEMRLLTSEEDSWVKKHAGKADCVLIDAPCSGVGTWRRSPFSRWQQLGPSLKQLVAVQESILASAARLVKSGGRLMYATCSLLPEENQEQVDRFLSNHPDFTPIPLLDNWLNTGEEVPAGLDLSGSSLQLTPARHNVDGFYIAAMRRR